MDGKTAVKRAQNPREKANVLSSLFFVHMFPVFVRNLKKTMQVEDLYEPLEEHKSNILGDRLEELWTKYRKNYEKTALHRALLRLVAFEIIVTGMAKLVNEILLIVVPPYAIGRLVAYFSSASSNISDSDAYLYVGMIIAGVAVETLLNHPIMMLISHLCMKMRIASCSLVYRKSLRLSRTSLASTTVGQIVNLLSNDVSKFDQGFVLLHYFWVAPIQMIIGTYFLYRSIGVSAFSGVAFLSLFIPIQIYLGKRTSTLRLKTALRTDERVRLMNEILNGIQVIKMYTWEKPFEKLVGYIRRSEIKPIRIHFYLEAIMFSFEHFITRASIFISIIVFISLGNKIDAEKVYSITALYSVMRPVITFLFTISISSIAEVNISICRLRKFLEYEELPQYQKTDLILNANTLVNDGKEKLNFTEDVKPKVVLKSVTAKWLEDNSDDTLTDINLTIDKNQLVAVIGSVGSGKSSLLNIILREFPMTSGVLQVEGKVSYASQEAWLFSASVRQNILFGEIYQEKRYKTILKVCALETDMAMFPHGDATLVGEKGKSLSGGQKARINLARCIYKQADIYLLDDPLSAVDTKVGKQLYDECIKGFLQDKICILITHQLQYIKSADKIVIMEDGRIAGEGTYDFLQDSGLDFAILLEKFQSGEEAEDPEKKIRIRKNSELKDVESDDESVEDSKEVAITGSISSRTYKFYFKAGGNTFIFILLALSFIASQIAGNGSDYFVTYWVNLEQDVRESNGTKTIDRSLIIYEYTAITLTLIVLSLGHLIFYFSYFMNASIKIHDYIFEKILKGNMRFFNSNPTGRILNRFSKDMGIIDEYIPFVMVDVIEIFLTLVGVLTLTCIVNPWLIIPSVIQIIIFYLIRLLCINTSRSIKRIEGITRSPIFNHITASMHGLATIRAFSAQKILVKEFDHHQDLHSSSWYLFLTSTRAFGLWLDIICLIFMSLIVTSLIFLNKGYYGGDVGLIITQYMGLMGILQWGMRQWAEMENQMTSVERVQEYTQIESEPERQSITNLPKNWPENGQIVFHDVSMKYTINDIPVLKKLNFTIYPKEKIGVVGRTGAGKSSTIAALFQLYDIDGSIIIDGVDTTQLPLDVVRPKISIIPQEPMLFSGTMRKNLDPFEEYNDDVIWDALEQVELKSIIAEMPEGLNLNVYESGSNFSVGQRQLVCLARAIIRHNKILVMDEATANVDPHTDSLIQSTIRRRFSECTVITIAHRLHTIMDCDRVLVVEGGQVVDFDHPFNLIQKEGSVFAAMVQTTGSNASKNLISIAEESYKNLKQE